MFNKKKYPFVYSGHNYALDIVSGKILSSKYILAACERYLRDVVNESANFYFDVDEAEKYLRCVQQFEHAEGHWDTPHIKYEPWQCWVFMNIMGFIVKKTKFRRFRLAHLEVARGNAKSTMASQACLYFLALDNPNGNLISTVATKKEQARIVLDSARAMAQKSKSFLRYTGVQVLAHSVVHRKSHSQLRALSSDTTTLDGLKDVLAVCDELHEMNRKVFEVIYSGMSKRKDSLLLCITTAGDDLHSVGYSQTGFAKKVATGEADDDSFFAAVYTLDEGDDWADENCWIKANPNLGVSVDIDSLRAKVDKALVTPADIANIRIKHFNQWISEAHAFFDLESWDKCANPKLNIRDFERCKGKAGLDLASHIDLTSIGIVYKRNGKYFIFDKTYIPEETVKKKKSVLYEDCIAKGFLNKTKGAAINYENIRNELLSVHNFSKLDECMYDPWNATETAQKLESKIDMVKVAMNTSNLSEPMKKLDALIREGKVEHNGSPLLRWCLSNVVSKEDHNGNVFPRKNHEDNKIDPIVAILLALCGFIQDDDGDSVYETRGLLSL